MKLALALGAALALAVPLSPAVASTIVVDANGSGQFTDLPPAIAAAQPGDVLLVLAGQYSSFLVDKRLVIVGQGEPSIPGTSSVVNPAGGLVALAGLRPYGLSVSNSPGPVVLQDLGTFALPLVVDTANDVRVSRTDVHIAGELPWPGPTAVTAEMARLEFAGCSVIGYTSTSYCPTCTIDGELAIQLGAATRAHLARTSSRGGKGIDTYNQTIGGDGAGALEVHALAEAIVAGGGVALFHGGDCGFGQYVTDCPYDGQPASGAYVYGSLRTSAAKYQGGCCFNIAHCTINDIPASGIEHSSGATITQAVPADPTLELVGDPIVGSTITFKLRGDPGAQALLWFGRQAVVQPDPAAVIELLTPMARLVQLGTLPASGEAQFSWTIPSVLAKGTFLCAQASVTLPSGAVERTNSVPIVVR